MSAVEDLKAKYFITASGPEERFHDARVGEALLDLAERIDRLEAVVRAFGLHEPDCPLFIEIRDEVGHSGKYYPTKTCTCWLSKTKEPT